ncbi:MAG: hypothetical protein QF921_11725 [Pseudomonadales bacterium]|jgi:hypothetical protein|nr:hypothetical protein [Pseudomonadales bacterium]MDP6470525.1 hypothetical protein [Pseudomonadales bacterium]MDP6827827.1 hypothetical protein [Pseudomonadales bacterium]MDP6972159.1 hypothetical protein [Pseudomonadales bacterium]|tara:strand:- start:35 stop:610 length:576 start_codon:yes stop_codon:yes gene_type:complete
MKAAFRDVPFRTSVFAVLLSIATSVSGAMHDPHAVSADPEGAAQSSAPRLEGLGAHTMGVTTASADSQYFFNQGLNLTYAFNHAQALRAFKEAARLGPNNAMAYWGWVLVLGPNINLPMQEAASVYWQDLRRHPDNGCAFFGLSEALAAQGDARAQVYAAKFHDAWRDAHVTLSSSRFKNGFRQQGVNGLA